MSYLAISQMQQNPPLRSRITACCAQEGAADPEQTAHDIMWAVCASPGWGEAWDYAVAVAIQAGPQNATDPGMDPAVITDEMILSAVQPLIQP